MNASPNRSLVCLYTTFFYCCIAFSSTSTQSLQVSTGLHLSVGDPSTTLALRRSNTAQNYRHLLVIRGSLGFDREILLDLQAGTGYHLHRQVILSRASYTVDIKLDFPSLVFH